MKTKKIKNLEKKVKELKEDNNEYEASHIAVFEHNKELKTKLKESGRINSRLKECMMLYRLASQYLLSANETYEKLTKINNNTC